MTAHSNHLASGFGLLAVTVLAAAVPPALAASTPAAAEAGVQMAAGKRAEAVLLPHFTGKTVIRADMPRPQTSLSDLRFSVQGFRIENHPFISSEEIERILSAWSGRELSFAEFEEAVHAVADYLRANGHPNAEVVVSRAALHDGQVAIAIQGLAGGVGADPTVAVREFNVTGLTATATPEELRAVLAPYADQELTVAEMQKAAEAVAAHIRNKGYPLAQAFLPPQKIDSGVIEIRVQEGILDGKSGHGGITVKGAGQRVRPEVIETVLSKGVTPGQPVESGALERAIRIAGDLPGVRSLRSNMVPGSEPGTTQIQAEVEEGKLLTGTVWADNFGSRYTGENRANALLNINSPFRYGEQFSFTFNQATGMDSSKVAAQMPVGADGLRVGASYASMKVDIGQELVPLNINSSTEIASLFASYPLIRSDRTNLWLSANYDDKTVKNNLTNAPESERHLRIGTLSVNGDYIDPWLGQNTWNFAFLTGENSIAPVGGFDLIDQVTARTAGNFSKFTWQLGRLTPLLDNDRLGLFTGFSGQLASKNLDTVEKFQLGGPTGVRAYPVGEGLGDQGWLGNIELRSTLARNDIGEWGVFGFYDIGQVTQYKKPWDGAIPDGRNNTYSLRGYGVGASLSNAKYGSVRVIFAQKDGKNPNPTPAGTDGDGSNNDSRIWIFGSVVF